MLLRGAPAGTHTPSLTARPGGSKIASTQRAPAGGYVAISPRQVDVPGTGPGSGRVAVPPEPQHPPRTRVNDSYRPAVNDSYRPVNDSYRHGLRGRSSKDATFTLLSSPPMSTHVS